MISTLFPGFLVAGALFATLPVALHLLARRPPDRRPLPTARFLREEQRTLLRMSRRPSDVPLLIVRMLFALTLGACFAGVTWASERTGVARVLLVDVEAAADIGVEQLFATVRVAIEDGEESGLTTRVVGYAADESGSLVASAELEELTFAVGESKTTAADGLRVLRSTMASETALDSVAVVWIMQPTWHQWTKGVGLVREGLWPGAVEIRATAPAHLDRVGVDTRVAAGATTASTKGFSAEAALRPALAALGADMVEPEPGTAPGADWFFVESPRAEDLGALMGHARAGATVVLTGALPNSSEAAAVPWDPNVRMPGGSPGPGVTTPSPGPTISSPGTILREGRPPLAINAPAAEGAPASDAHVIAVFENARPAAAARSLGNGCVVYTAIALTDDALTGTAGYVDLVDDLAHGCPSLDGDLPLDRGALTALARPDLPAHIALADLDAPSGKPLTPALLLLALALLGTEVLLTRSERA